MENTEADAWAEVAPTVRSDPDRIRPRPRSAAMTRTRAIAAIPRAAKEGIDGTSMEAGRPTARASGGTVAAAAATALTGTPAPPAGGDRGPPRPPAWGSGGGPAR